MKTKAILWSVVSILILGLAAGGSWWMSRPQVITFSDGTKLTLIGVTYGKHHISPKIKIAGNLTRGNNGGGAITSTNDTFVVWIEVEHKPNDYLWQNYRLMVYDKANTACIGYEKTTGSEINNAVNIVGCLFVAYPRWDRTMIVRILSNGNGGPRLSKEQFVISNPARKSFPKWTPEAMPDTQSDGDLAVTLTKLGYIASSFGGVIGSANDPLNKAVLAAFHTEQKGVKVTNWQPVKIETSDASGNRAPNNIWSTGRYDNGDATMTYQWGLWPDQPWKLRVEMSRTAGFDADEAWLVTNVPVSPGGQQEMWNYNQNGRTKPAFAETTLQGIHLKIYPALVFTNNDANSGNSQKQGGFRIMADPDPTSQGFRMTLSSVTDEQGRGLQNYNGGGGGGNYQFQLQNIRNTKMLNVTVALHKSRVVEFMVKPEKQ